MPVVGAVIPTQHRYFWEPLSVTPLVLSVDDADDGGCSDPYHCPGRSTWKQWALVSPDGDTIPLVDRWSDDYWSHTWDFDYKSNS